MSIEKILSISGKPGLYALKLQTRTGFVAESLSDGKKVTVGLRSNVSLLSEISVYTYDGEVRLSEVFRAIAAKEDNGPAISHKEDNATLTNYFRKRFLSLMRTEYMLQISKKYLTGITRFRLKVLFLKKSLLHRKLRLPKRLNQKNKKLSY